MKSTNTSTTNSSTGGANSSEGEKKSINPELWQACAGPLVNLPAGGTHVVYFPQGHSEQVAASMKRDIDAQIPSYPNLPSKLLCLLHSVTLHADPETDEVYAQMTLQPVPSFDKEALLRSDLSLRAHKPQTEFFCKTLTASDTSTHGGFSVPRRSAEKIFPPLDFSMQPPAQELVARDLHDNVWTFRHIYRGQPKRHLLTTGWSLFVSGKKLFAGDSVLFIRDEKQQLLLGLRRANRQPTNLSSSVLSSDSMHIGILAAAAHAAANNSPFTVFYNPRTSPSEFVIPLAKYYKAIHGQQISLGMRFRMMFETEESGTRRYMGTITGISDLDSLRWKNSQWRNLQVGWDESTAGEKRTRVSVWEIEPVTAPFFICPPPFLGTKRPRLPGMPDDDSSLDSLFKRTMPWFGDDPHAAPGLSLMQWMNIQQNPTLANPMQSGILNTLPGSVLTEPPHQLGFTAPHAPLQNNLQFDSHRLSSGCLNPLSSLVQSQPPLSNVSQQPRQNFIDPTLASSSLQNHQLQGNMSSILQQQQRQPVLGQNQQPSLVQTQQAQVTDNQIQLQMLQRLQQQQQSLLSQQQAINQFQDMTQTFSRSLPPSQVLDMVQTQVTNLGQSHILSQQINKCNSQMMSVQKLHQQPVIMPEIPMSNNIPTLGGTNLTRGIAVGQSSVTDEIPSCSTSPSTNNGPIAVQTVLNSNSNHSNAIAEGIQHSATILHSNRLGPVSSNGNIVKELHHEVDVKPSIDVSKIQNQGHLNNRHTFQSVPSQLDYLDTSSATSASFSQNDILSQSNHLPNSQSIHDLEVQANLSNDINPRGTIEDLQRMPLVSDMRNVTTNVTSSGFLLSNYDSVKDAQQELSSSMVTQSFGVPDMAFNSIDSGISDNSLVNRGTWTQPPQRMRTYTKVYKRGAVGRSIDVTRYSGYKELKQDLARMFGIEGQMEDRGRVGWKLVYVDHENDVLLVGDDPWEDFVNCVRCIKILSPQEVQQMSLDGDFGNASLPNQACSSSDGGNL